MFRLGLLAAAVWAVAASFACAAPLEVYGRLPNIERVAISPDGSALCIVWTDGAQRRLIVQTAADHKLIGAFDVGAAKIRSVQWAGNDHVILTSSRTGTIMGVDAARAEWRIAFDLNLKTKKLHGLLGDTAEALNVVIDAPEVRVVDGKPVVYLQGVHFEQHQGVNTLYRINLDSDASKQVEVGFEGARDWVLDPDGVAISQLVFNDRSGKWTLKQKINGLWRDTKSPTLDETPDMLGLGRDGHSILMRELKDGEADLREVSPDGTWGAPLRLQEADEVIFDPVRHNLIGYYALVGDRGHYTFFDPADQALWDGVAAAYPNQGVELMSWSDDHRKMVVRVDSATEGVAFAVVNLDTRQAAWLGGEYEKIGPMDVAPVKPVKFKAADGLELSGYLTAPRGKDLKSLPLIVFPHGGPAARDDLGFDWWAQAMASRGYAVLQVNFRGSDGYGWKFLSAGFGEWGRKMQTDISDGVAVLAKNGIVDPHRVCIAGGSYGGYAALAGVTVQNGLYRCAASYGGVTALRDLLNDIADRDRWRGERYEEPALRLR
ncbi:alpha/beta hydrolase family protein, partial [Phenylobacterium sp.]|uniref:alpha/beta hydrolase family protein n=1 Tax=Phenylobacterium sp. TaxID=1871053 RepID=UPI002E329F02